MHQLRSLKIDNPNIRWMLTKPNETPNRLGLNAHNRQLEYIKCRELGIDFRCEPGVYIAYHLPIELVEPNTRELLPDDSITAVWATFRGKEHGVSLVERCNSPLNWEAQVLAMINEFKAHE